MRKVDRLVQKTGQSPPSKPTARLGGLSSVSLLAMAAGLALAGPAWADGGSAGSASTGGVSYPGGAGGVDGPLSSSTGVDGVSAAGGGGGVDLTTGNGAPGGAGTIPLTPPAARGTAGLAGTTGQFVAAPAQISTTVSGGAGNAGQTEVVGVNTAGGNGGGGAGVSATSAVTVTATGRVTGGTGFSFATPAFHGGAGGGGVGVFSSANVTVDSGGQVTGGAGGSNTSGPNIAGAGGGAAAILLTNGATVQNSGVLTGGAGGRSTNGGGGDGGAGVQMLAGGTVVNMAGGAITGGAGGNGRVIAGSSTNPGDGAAGIKGAGISIINAGAITGGAGGTGAGWTPVSGQAIQFTGGVNSLEIWSTSNITGAVQAFSAADTFKLGGTTDSSFDLSQIDPTTGKYLGFGQFAKTGTGAWTLTGTTAQVTPWTLSGGVLKISSDGALGAPSGGLTFNGGALETTADITSTRAVAMTGAGTINTDAGTTLTFGGPISGAGGLTKAGAGTLVLTGDAAHAGGTTIAAGTLQIGAGGISGSIAGAIADNAVLAFDRSDALAIAGAISGTGAVSQIGPGTTTLSGANTYSGGTTISGGVLKGSAANFGSGAVQDNAALVIDQPADAAFANPINGSGGFTKTGVGQLTYTGTGGLTGPTTVSAGVLSVNGALASSAFAVMSGATLKGSGTVGATTVQAGGTVAPGNSIGVLHVNGAFVQQAGSTYQAEVDPTSNASDRISVSGAATLAPGAGLTVVKTTPGNYRMGAVYTVLEASGGVNGTYTLAGDIQPVSAFLALKGAYDASHVYLSVVQTADPSSVAGTPNEGGAAGGLPGGGDLTDAVLNSPTDAAARHLLDQLAGDGHAAARGVLASDSRLVRGLAIDRVQGLFCGPDGLGPAGKPDAACAEDGRPSAWGQALGAWGRTDGNGNAGGVDRATGGFLIGADAAVAGTWRAGAFLGYSHTRLVMDDNAAAADIDSYHLGAYGGTQYGRLGLRLGASYTVHDIHTDRSVLLPNLPQQLQADYGADTAQGFGQAGYRLNLGKGAVEPFVEAAYVSVHARGFTERGGVAALTSHAGDTDAIYSTLGVKPSLPLTVGGVQASLHGLFGWRHDYGDTSPANVVRFVAGGSPFSVEGAPLARDAGLAEIGVDMKNGNAVFGVTYGAQGWTHDFDQTVRANLRLAF